MTTNGTTQPPHPGEFLQELYLEPGNISIRELAGRLQVSASTLQRLISCQSRLTPDMALRLSRVVGIKDLQYGGLSAGGWPMHQLTPSACSSSRSVRTFLMLPLVQLT